MARSVGHRRHRDPRHRPGCSRRQDRPAGSGRQTGLAAGRRRRPRVLARARASPVERRAILAGGHARSPGEEGPHPVEAGIHARRRTRVHLQACPHARRRVRDAPPPRATGRTCRRGGLDRGDLRRTSRGVRRPARTPLRGGAPHGPRARRGGRVATLERVRPPRARLPGGPPQGRARQGGAARSEGPGISPTGHSNARSRSRRRPTRFSTTTGGTRRIGRTRRPPSSGS